MVRQVERNGYRQPLYLGTQLTGWMLKHRKPLLIYSDVITGAINPQGEEFGEQRLQRTTESALGENPGGIIERISAKLDQFTQNAPLEDDRALIAIQRVS